MLLLLLLSVATGTATANEARLAQLEFKLESTFEQLHARIRTLEGENEQLKARVSTLEGDNEVRRRADRTAGAAAESYALNVGGRQLSSMSSPTCCRWTQDGTCPASQTKTRHQKCTFLHEYLEGKTTTHEFEDVESCLGTDESQWSWEYKALDASVSLSGGGGVAVSSPTPLRVTHDAGCNGQFLTVQMNTTLAANVDILGSLFVAGSLVTGAGTWTSGGIRAATGYTCTVPCMYLVQNGHVFLKGRIDTNSGSFTGNPIIGYIDAEVARPYHTLRMVLAGNSNSYPYLVVRFRFNGEIDIVGSANGDRVWLDGTNYANS